MLLVIKVEKKLSDEDISDAMDNKDITVTGTVLSMHSQDEAVDEYMEKAEALDNLIHGGVVDPDDINLRKFYKDVF